MAGRNLRGGTFDREISGLATGDRLCAHYRYLDMSTIRRLATLHDISITTGNLPDWVRKSTARIIPEKGRARNNERFYDKSRY